MSLYRPSNVLLNEYSNLKLCDFGLAKKIVDLLQADPESNKVTPIRISTDICIAEKWDPVLHGPGAFLGRRRLQFLLRHLGIGLHSL